MIILIVLTSCSTSKNVLIEGDMYFQMVDFFNLNNAPDSLISKIENKVKQTNIDTLTSIDKKGYEMIQYAIKINILRKPYIRLETKEGNILMLYMDKDKYLQFDSLKCFDLRYEGKKIHIIAKAQDITFKDIKAYRLIRFKKINKINGDTRCRK